MPDRPSIALRNTSSPSARTAFHRTSARVNETLTRKASATALAPSVPILLFNNLQAPPQKIHVRCQQSSGVKVARSGTICSVRIGQLTIN